MDAYSCTCLFLGRPTARLGPGKSAKLLRQGSPTVADLPLKQVLWTDSILRAAWGVTRKLAPALLSLGPLKF